MVVAGAATVVPVVMPTTTATMREKEAAAHAQHDQQWNQQCDSTEHFKILQGSHGVTSGWLNKSIEQAKAFHRL